MSNLNPSLSFDHGTYDYHTCTSCPVIIWQSQDASMNVIQMSDFLELFQTLTLILGALQGLQIAMQQLSATKMTHVSILDG